MYYPNLGDITGALKNMPALEHLELLGVFELKTKINLQKLKKITVGSCWVTDEQLGFISQNTLDMLLASNFVSLETLDLDLICGHSYTTGVKHIYELNERLLLNFRALNSLNICGHFKQEIDLYTINTISTKIKSLSPAELDKFRNESGSALSFLQGEAEFDLFKNNTSAEYQAIWS